MPGTETFGPAGNLGRDSERDAVLRRELREALARLNPNLPESAPPSDLLQWQTKRDQLADRVALDR